MLEQPSQLPNSFGIFASGAGWLVAIELLKCPVDINPVIKLLGLLVEQPRPRQNSLFPRWRRMHPVLVFSVTSVPSLVVVDGN